MLYTVVVIDKFVFIKGDRGIGTEETELAGRDTSAAASKGGARVHSGGSPSGLQNTLVIARRREARYKAAASAFGRSLRGAPEARIREQCQTKQTKLFASWVRQ